MGPGEGNPSDSDGGEDQVVQDAAWLPEACGIGEVVTEWGGCGEELRLSGLRVIHARSPFGKSVWQGNCGAVASFCQVLCNAELLYLRPEKRRQAAALQILFANDVRPVFGKEVEKACF